MHQCVYFYLKSVMVRGPEAVGAPDIPLGTFDKLSSLQNV